MIDFGQWHSIIEFIRTFTTSVELLLSIPKTVNIIIGQYYFRLIRTESLYWSFRRIDGYLYHPMLHCFRIRWLCMESRSLCSNTQARFFSLFAPWQRKQHLSIWKYTSVEWVKYSIFEILQIACNTQISKLIWTSAVFFTPSMSYDIQSH